MFAVIQTGGKQFRVAADEVLKVGKLGAQAGEIVTFPVLMLGGDSPVVGGPTVEGAQVAAEVIEQGRSRTVIAFKKRRRKNSKRKRGYRDPFTLVRITEILTDGKQPTKSARARPEKKVEAPAEGEAAAPAEKPKAKAKAEFAAVVESTGYTLEELRAYQRRLARLDRSAIAALVRADFPSRRGRSPACGRSTGCSVSYLPGRFAPPARKRGHPATLD